MKTHTVEKTKGADTIYVPKDQEGYFKALGYSAAAPSTAAPAAAPAAADAKTKETTR